MTRRGPVEPITNLYNRPVLFYSLATAIPWALWLGAGWLSHRPEQTGAIRVATATLGLIGLFTPMMVAGVLVWKRAELRRDVAHRLLWRRGTSPLLLIAAVVLPLASLMTAQAISLLFGYSADQFHLRHGYSFTSGLLPTGLILVLAPIVEELAWHSYGTDALVSRMRLISASGLFTVIWALWHAPLSYIKGYYQAELVEQGWLDTLNFPVSMIAFVIIMNWLYYRTGRSIAVAIVFHAASNVVNEMFLTNPDSKLIQTAVLLVLAAFLLWHDPELFFGRPNRKASLVSADVSQ